MANSVKQLDPIGVFCCTNDATTTVQISEIGIFTPKARYGCLVVRNESGAAIHSDDVECHIVLAPLEDEIQN